MQKPTRRAKEFKEQLREGRKCNKSFSQNHYNTEFCQGACTISDPETKKTFREEKVRADKYNEILCIMTVKEFRKFCTRSMLPKTHTFFFFFKWKIPQRFCIQQNFRQIYKICSSGQEVIHPRACMEVNEAWNSLSNRCSVWILI